VIRVPVRSALWAWQRKIAELGGILAQVESAACFRTRIHTACCNVICTYGKHGSSCIFGKFLPLSPPTHRHPAVHSHSVKHLVGSNSQRMKHGGTNDKLGPQESQTRLIFKKGNGSLSQFSQTMQHTHSHELTLVSALALSVRATIGNETGPLGTHSGFPSGTECCPRDIVMNDSPACMYSQWSFKYTPHKPILAAFCLKASLDKKIFPGTTGHMHDLDSFSLRGRGQPQT
jgi:hypothetical protein